MKTVDEVKKLELPHGECLVVGSGVMSALGIRESADIDLLVTPRAFEELRARGWEYRAVEIDGRRRERLSCGAAEAYADIWYGDERRDAAALFASATVIHGVPFQSVPELLKMKRAMGREKDRRDIALLEEHPAHRAE